VESGSVVAELGSEMISDDCDDDLGDVVVQLFIYLAYEHVSPCTNLALHHVNIPH
jgi:hypothetical protein